MNKRPTYSDIPKDIRDRFFEKSAELLADYFEGKKPTAQDFESLFPMQDAFLAGLELHQKGFKIDRIIVDFLDMQKDSYRRLRNEEIKKWVAEQNFTNLLRAKQYIEYQNDTFLILVVDREIGKYLAKNKRTQEECFINFEDLL